MDWDILIKAIGAVAGGVLSIYQIRNMQPRLRAHLRADLEILKLLDRDDPGFNTVRQSVDKQIHMIYGANQLDTTWTARRLGSLIIGIAWAAGFAYWTFEGSRYQFNWWSVLSGIVAVLGVFFIIGILVENKPTSTTKTASDL